MRRTSIVAVGIGALAVVSMALLVPAGAGAQTPATTTTTKAPTLVEALCAKIPTLLEGHFTDLPLATAAIDTARQNVEAKQVAMTAAMGELATAVVEHLGVLDAGGNSAASGSVLKGKQALYVDAVVAWSKARAQLYDGEQLLTFGELQKTLLDSIDAGTC